MNYKIQKIREVLSSKKNTILKKLFWILISLPVTQNVCFVSHFLTKAANASCKIS